MRDSIVFKKQECFVCGTKNGLNSHEIFYGTSNRKKSIEDKMVAYLCGYHHNLSSNGVHQNRELDLKLKRMAQQVWEETYGTREEFIKRYGKSWL